MGEHFTTVEFRNYKALKQFSLSLQEMNILVGPNNCGKSTIIGAFRVLAAGLRRARMQNPSRIVIGNDVLLGYPIPRDSIGISTENIHTDYADTDSTVTFRLSNGNKLIIMFPKKGDGALIPEARNRRIASPKTFKAEFPISVAEIPVLGPLEHEEAVVQPATVQRNLTTHLASRHFRNFWFYYPEGFLEFAELVKETWPGMEIEAPEQEGEKMLMFCRENRMTRELFWSGFGFQIWCQILTHLARAKNDTLLIVDEPEVYLHPDVQRQLLGILRLLGPRVLLATHSTEIMSEADPSEIILIDKMTRSGERLKDIAGVLAALEQIGSVQNITLTRLARSRRVLFVEGDDFSLITKFARIAGNKNLALGSEIASVSMEGFSGWERIRSIAWGLNKTLGTSLLLAVVLDRDYHPDEEIEGVRKSLEEHVEFVHIHERKEIENYLLIPSVIERAIKMALRSSGSASPFIEPNIENMLEEITSPMKTKIIGQFVAKHCTYFRSSGVDQAIIATQAMERFDCLWGSLCTRLSIVPGKEVLKRIRDRIQGDYGITLTIQRIINAFRKDQIPGDLQRLLDRLESFRTNGSREAEVLAKEVEQ
jgi:predicted ATPase